MAGSEIKLEGEVDSWTMSHELKPEGAPDMVLGSLRLRLKSIYSTVDVDMEVIMPDGPMVVAHLMEELAQRPRSVRLECSIKITAQDA